MITKMLFLRRADSMFLAVFQNTDSEIGSSFFGRTTIRWEVTFKTHRKSHKFL